MDVHVSSMNATVRAVDDRTLVSPEVMDVIVREVLARLASDRGVEASRRRDASMWESAREDER